MSARRALAGAAAVVGGFVAVQLLLFAGLVVGASVPDDPIVDHLAADIEDGLYGPAKLRDRMGGAADSFTECVVAGTGLGGVESDVVSKAAVMPRLHTCADAPAEVAALQQGQVPNADTSYLRYWAGYTAITKPVLALFGVTGLRLAAGFLLVVGLWAAVRFVGSATSTAAAAALVVPLVLATNLMSTPSTSFSHALTVGAALGGAAATAWAFSRSRRAGLLAVALSAAGFCYVDLLTIPSGAWALCASVAAGTTWVRSGSVRGTAVAVALAGVVWPVAFAATWVSRWVIAVPFAGWERVEADVRAKVVERTEGDSAGVVDEFGAPTDANWTYWMEHVATARAVVVLAVVVAVVAVVLAVVRRGPARIAVAALVALPALVTPVWYEVLSNHSQIHESFTYRALAVSCGILVFAGVVAATDPRPMAPAEPGEPGEPGEPAEPAEPAESAEPGRVTV